MAGMDGQKIAPSRTAAMFEGGVGVVMLRWKEVLRDGGTEIAVGGAEVGAVTGTAGVLVGEEAVEHNNRVVVNIGRNPLTVFVQVNTSGEESKSGVDPSVWVELVKRVSLACPNLEFCGLEISFLSALLFSRRRPPSLARRCPFAEAPSRHRPSLRLDNVSTQSTSETEKPRHNLRKVSSHPADSVQEHPQNELEKVKRSLRKVHNPNTEGSIQSEADSEKPKYGLEKVLSFSYQNTAEENISDSGEKIKKGTTVTVSKLPDLEATLEPPVVSEAIDLLCDDQTAVESQPPENSGFDETK